MKRLWLLVSVLVLCLSRTAHAGGAQPLPVLSLQTDDAVAEARALTDALESAVASSSGYALPDGEYSLEVMTLALGCSDPPSESCLTMIANKLKTRHFVWGSLERAGKKLRIHIRMYRKGGESTEVIARFRATRDGERLAAVASQLLSRLHGEVQSTESAVESPAQNWREPEDEPPGQLVIRAGDATGQVLVDGRAYGKIKNGYAKIEVPAGDHEVAIRAQGYSETMTQVVVEPKRRAEVTLYPELSDGPGRPSSPDSEARSNAGAGWAAIGVGALLVGGGAYSAVRASSVRDEPAFKSYQAAVQNNQDACVSANRGIEHPGAASSSSVKSLCTKERMYESLQVLLFGLGGVALGTGALILIIDGPSSDAPERDSARGTVRAEPRVAVGRDSAEVGVHLSF